MRRLIRGWAGRALLAAAGTLFALLLVEVGMRLAYAHLPYAIAGWIAHVRLWAVAGPALGPDWLDYCVGDAEFAARNLPGLAKSPVQFGPARYRLDTRPLGDVGYGFRGSDTGPPWDGVVVGDSFTFCHHVEYRDCWVHRLERESGLALANLGVPGTGGVSHARYLERFGRALAPRLVLWQYWVNDVRDDAEHVLGKHLPCPRVRAVAANLDWRGALKQGSVVANLARAARAKKSGSARVPINGRGYYFQTTDGRPLMMWPNEAGAPGSEAMQSALRLTTGAIGSAARRTLAAGGQFLLLIAPSNLQAYADRLAGPNVLAELQAEDWTSDQIVAYAHDNDIPCLDLRPVFRTAAAAGADLYPWYDVHWTPAGNALAAREIAAWLRTHPLAERGGVALP